MLNIISSENDSFPKIVFYIHIVRNIILLLHIGQGPSFGGYSYVLQNSYSGGNVGGNQGNLAGANYGRG